MPVHPTLLPFLPAPTFPDDIDFPTWRAANAAETDVLTQQVAEPGPQVASRQVISIPVDGGAIELAAYRPATAGLLPLHLYIHGGGWVAGSALDAAIDNIARERAIAADCVVVAVNYRKAPEHPAPTALLDCHAALTWLLQHAEGLGVDPRVITVGGHSAGGNLSAALALKVRDEGGPRLALQLLEVPALDLTLSLPSHNDRDLGSLYQLHRRDTELMIAAYLGDHGNPRDPYISPLHATDLTGVAPAYIMSAEFDLLRDDGQVYADMLRAAGVPVTFSLQLDHIHASSLLTRLTPIARQWREEVHRVLSAAHRGSLTLPVEA